MLRQFVILITWAVLWDSRRARSTERLIIDTSISIGCFIIITVTFAPSILGGHLRRLEIVIYVRLGLILRCSDNLVILTTWAVLWACRRATRSAERLINDTPTALAVSPSSPPPPLHPPSLVVFFRDSWFLWGSLPSFASFILGGHLQDGYNGRIWLIPAGPLPSDCDLWYWLWYWYAQTTCDSDYLSCTVRESRGRFRRYSNQWHLPQPWPFHHHHRHLCTLHPWWLPSGWILL